ncbi:MAG: hypothetical protein ACLTXL_15595 [Clostridia bacterium]
MPTATSSDDISKHQIRGVHNTFSLHLPHKAYIDGEVIHQGAAKSILMFHDLTDDMLGQYFMVSHICPTSANGMRQVFFVRHALKLLVQPVYIETGDMTV